MTSWVQLRAALEARGPWITLDEMSCGAIFETQNGIRAVKSEYRYSNEYPAIECILLASGEYAHFCQGEVVEDGFDRARRHNATIVREIAPALAGAKETP